MVALNCPYCGDTWYGGDVGGTVQCCGLFVIITPHLVDLFYIVAINTWLSYAKFPKTG